MKTGRSSLLSLGLGVVLTSIAGSGCLESKIAFGDVSAVRLDDDRVRVEMTIENVGDDDARRACVKVIWRDEVGIIDTRLTCAEHLLHGGSLWYGDYWVLCPEEYCPSKETMKADSHWKIPRSGVTIEVRVTRGGDPDSMDDHDVVHTFTSP